MLTVALLTILAIALAAWLLTRRKLRTVTARSDFDAAIVRELVAGLAENTRAKSIGEALRACCLASPDLARAAGFRIQPSLWPGRLTAGLAPHSPGFTGGGPTYPDPDNRIDSTANSRWPNQRNGGQARPQNG